MLHSETELPIFVAVASIVKSTDGRKLKRAARIPGICRDAVACGVSRQHLQAALTGKRVGSARLMSLYAARRQNRGSDAGATNQSNP
jgi:hypothetical protein